MRKRRRSWKNKERRENVWNKNSIQIGIGIESTLEAVNIDASTSLNGSQLKCALPSLSKYISQSTTTHAHAVHNFDY